MCSWGLCWENRVPKYFQRVSFVSRITSVNRIVLKVRQDWRRRTNVTKKIKHFPHAQGLKMKCRGLGSEVPLQARSRSQVHARASYVISMHLRFLTWTMELWGRLMTKMTLILPSPVFNQWQWDFAAPFMLWWHLLPYPLILGWPWGLHRPRECGTSALCLRHQEHLCVSVLFLSELWYHHKDKLALDCWEKRDHVEQSQASPFSQLRVTDTWED